MRRKYRKLFLWSALISAVIFCWVGWAGMEPVDATRVPDHFYLLVYLLVWTPHLLAFLLVVYACRVNITAVIVALIGSALVACIPWAEQACRETEGLEFRFNNALMACMWCLVSYGMVVLSIFGVAKAADSSRSNQPDSAPAQGTIP